MTNNPVLVFLDANVLAKPVTRSLILFASTGSNYAVGWSATAETEADRHLRAKQTTINTIRQAAGLELTPTGVVTGFLHTSATDRQILADAVAAEASFIITEDVDDFDINDLTSVDITAVNPDLYLAEAVTSDAYAQAIRRMAAAMTNPPRTPEQLHAAIGRQHPRTVTAHRAAFSAEPMPAANNPPDVIYRGTRCLRCKQHHLPLTAGICTNCLRNN